MQTMKKVGIGRAYSLTHSLTHSLLKLNRYFWSFRKKLLVFLLTFSLILSQLFSIFIPHVFAASSPWTQTDWSGGSGQTSWSDNAKFDSSSSVKTSASGEITLNPTSSWYNASWGYRRKITFDNSSQAENLTNFPVMVKLTSSNFDFTKAQSAGQDIRFTDSDGTTILPYEIESWDNSGQQAFLWTKVPQIDSSSATDFIYMYYGNSSVADAQNKTSVWSGNIKSRWHLNDATITNGSTISDSSANNANLQVVTNLSATTGKAGGKAISFNGSNLIRQPQLTSYNKATTDTDQGLFVSSATKYLAQGFQISSGATVGAVRLNFKKVGAGTPTTTHVAIRIETDLLGKPSGTAVTNGISNCYAVTTVTAYNWLGRFKFATNPVLSASTQYHIVLKPYTESTCTTEQSVADATNYIAWGYDNSSSSYASGDRATADATPTWTTQTGTDHAFEIYDNKLDH